MRELKLSDIQWKIKLHHEHTCVSDVFDDIRLVHAIVKDYENGNDWAWCGVEVIGMFHGIEASEYLGGCSYKNEEDFKSGLYYGEMRDAILYQIQLEVEEICNFMNKEN